MIRRSSEAPFFAIWRDAPVVRALSQRHLLTTARYEPVLRSQLGTGHIDLIFEDATRSIVLGGLRLEPNHLIVRGRSPIIWPVRIVDVVGGDELLAIEGAIVPWLCSLARARPMSTEIVRSFKHSARFARARELGLVGAASLDRSMLQMAPFIFARRFSRGASVLVEPDQWGLANAVLGDIAGTIECCKELSDVARFASQWYGVGLPDRARATAYDVAIVEDAERDAASVVISLSARSKAGARIDVPSPAPLDLLFAFDGADAPTAATFAVAVTESVLRKSAAPSFSPRAGDSSGTVVIALAAESIAQRGADFEEMAVLTRSLQAEGFTVHMAGYAGDPIVASASLVHIAGAPHDPHVSEFAKRAREHGTAYVLDLPPRAVSPSRYLEKTLVVLRRAAVDEADIARFMRAYLQRNLDASLPPEPNGEEYERLSRDFARYAEDAAGVFVAEADLEAARATLPQHVWPRIATRGIFADPEPMPAAIGHLVPSEPFAFTHAIIGTRSHALFGAMALENASVPLVIAGPMYDVEYLQTLRLAAPNAIILADAAPGVISALYRRADVWLDAAPRPSSAAWLWRAIACGAIPVIARESPLARIAGVDAPTFSLTSLKECEDAVSCALRNTSRAKLVNALQSRVLPILDPRTTFGIIMSAYSRSAALA